MARTILLVGLLAAGCTPATPTAPSAETWAGTWRIRLVQRVSQVTEATPAGAIYQLTVDGDRIAVRVDCNTCVGAFSTGGRQIRIGPLACTRAACSTAAFENSAASVLAGEHTAWVAGNRLTLQSARGVILLER